MNNFSYIAAGHIANHMMGRNFPSLFNAVLLFLLIFIIMKRLFYFLMTLSVVLLIASCAVSNKYDELSYVEESVNKESELEKFNRQMKLMKNIRFETDTFIFDMTLDEVRALGFPDSMYEYMQHKMKKKTDEARTIIAQGGRYFFFVVDSPNDTIHIR